MKESTYLALGDSMSIDDYTGEKGGGAVSQFFQSLADNWSLLDKTFDGCRMEDVPLGIHGDLITLTIGGNNLLQNRDRILEVGFDEFEDAHLKLLATIRDQNPSSKLIVGDIYTPGLPLSDEEVAALGKVNEIIAGNCRKVKAKLAKINEAFLGKEETYLCLAIEPTLEGATAIYQQFRACLDSY